MIDFLVAALPVLIVLCCFTVVGVTAIGYFSAEGRRSSEAKARAEHRATVSRLRRHAEAQCTATRKGALTMNEAYDAMGLNSPFERENVIKQERMMNKEWEAEQERLREQERKNWEREREVPWLIPGIDGPEKKEVTVGAYDVTEEFKGIRRS